MALFELREYKVLPGKMDEWLQFMEQEIMPFIMSKGMTINGSFRGVEDETTYIWIRRFDDEQHRQKLYEAVYESEVWKNELSPKVGQLIDRKAAIVRQLFATAQSPIQ